MGGFEITRPVESTVLLAEDEPRVRRLLAGALQRLANTVLIAANAMEALDISRARSARIDLLVTDVQMGAGPNGMELAGAMLRERPGMAVLVMSGDADWGRQAAERRFPFLAKPFTTAAFVEQVGKALSRSAAASAAGRLAPMAPIPSRSDERQSVERTLLNGIREAAQAYHRAAAEAKRQTEMSKAIGWNHPDGALAFHKAISSERLALEDYSLALHKFNDLVVHGRAPALRNQLERLLDTAIEAAAADKGNIQLLDRGAGVLTIEAQRGFELPFLNFFRHVPHGRFACGAAMQESGRVIVEDITQSPLFAEPASLQVLLDAGVQAVQSTPLVDSQGSVIGMLSTHYAKPTHPSEQGLQAIDDLGRQAAALVEGTCR